MPTSNSCRADKLMQADTSARMFRASFGLAALPVRQAVLCEVRRNASGALPQYMFIPRHARRAKLAMEHAIPSTAMAVAARGAVAEADFPSCGGLAAATELLSPAPKHAAGTFIRQLDIQNFALIDRQQITLMPGLNVVTGESGAGKSVLVQALNAILGAPALDGSVRPPADFAAVEGTLQLTPDTQLAASQLLASLGVPKKAMPAAGSRAAPSHLHIRREIHQDGTMLRSRCYVNGAVTSLRVLRELAAAFVDVNGQGSAQSLRDSETQVALLDRIAGTTAAASALAGRLRRLQELDGQLAAIDALGEEEERDALQALVDEVRALGVEEGEERQLRRELRRMEARRSAVERCGLVRTALGSEGGVAEGITTVEVHVQSILMQEEAHATHAREEREEAAEADGLSDTEEEGDGAVQLMEEALDILEHARVMLNEAESKVGSYARQYRFSAADQADISARLQAVMRLLKQHGCANTEELIAAATQAESSLDTWFTMEGRRQDIQAEADSVRGGVVSAAVDLSRRRRSAAGHLRAAVEACLAELAMSGSRFDVRIGWEPWPKGNSALHIGSAEAAPAGEAGGSTYRIRSSGLDAVEFLLAAGPAEPLRELAAVASGGESARIMMALKAAPTAAAAAASTSDTAEGLAAGGVRSLAAPIMVLDELDSGVGGRLGQPVAQMLRRMATGSQILCVSHLPQVAAHAEHHLCVRKALGADDRMFTAVVPLHSEEERVAEVAAMLGLDTSAAAAMVQDAQGHGSGSGSLRAVQGGAP